MELKANELRIGNLVKRKYWNPTWINPSFEYQTCRIVALGKENAIVVDINGKSEFKIPYSYLQPIPLTEEWLDEFSITKENEYPYKFINGFLKIRNGIFFYKYHEIEIELPFVHKLQNLYYELKDNELKLIK